MNSRVFILSAPSGGGKSVIAKELVKRISRLERVVTATTRERRPNEKNRRDYIFLPKQDFQRRIRTGGFLEWAKVHGNFYGVPTSEFERISKKKKSPLLIIDVQGAKTIRQKLPNIVSIFIKPESFQSLKKWMMRSGRGSSAEVRLRLKNAKKELKEARTYDYQIVNRDGYIHKTMKQISKIIKSEIDNKQ